MSTYNGYKAVSDPDANTYSSSPEDCAMYCYERDPFYVGAYFNSDVDDFNCRCYDRMRMNYTGDPSDETILFGTEIPEHTNTSNVTRTITATDASECAISCQVNDEGIHDSNNKAFVFDTTKLEDNCNCHTDNIVVFDNGQGKITGPTPTVIEQAEEQEDYAPLTKYFETSQLLSMFKDKSTKALLITFKIISVIVALILYSYYSHEDTAPFKLIKSIFIIIFSEFYLIYGFFKLIVNRYKKNIYKI